jgi:thiamine transport system permease protein
VTTATSTTTRRLATTAALAALPLAVLGVFFLLPVAGMVDRGLRPDGVLDPGAVLEVLTRPRTGRVVWFTLWTATLGTAVAVVLGLPAAYVLHRLRFPGRGLVRAALLVPFVLPTVVVGVAFDLLLRDGGPLAGLGLAGTPAAIVAGLVFFNVAVVVRSVGATWEGLDRRPAEAAAALGAGPWQVWWTVTVPALRPAVVSAASVVFLFCATAFGVVLVIGGVRYASVETEIYLLTANLLDLQAAAALSLVQLLAVVALLLVSARLRTTADPTRSRVVAAPRRPARGDAVPVVVTALVLLAVAAPVAALVVGSLRVDGAWSLASYRALGADPGDGGGQALLVPVTDALLNSLRTAVDATWMSVLLGLLVAAVVTRRSRSRAERRVRSLLDGLFMLPLGVSAVTLGFGFLVTLGRPPLELRDNPLLVPVLASVDERLRQAAASLGATPARALLAVDLPVLWKPLVGAAGFAFAVSLGEFGATSFLARPDHPTVPVVIFRLLGNPGELNYGMALAASVVLAATTAGVMLAVERLRVPSLGAW